jgi:nucleotide-binding universal stress UspA family protein
VQPGFSPAVICQSIEAGQVDLVVLGRHGYGGGLQDWLLGSVSKDVAHAATCDVLLISPVVP